MKSVSNNIKNSLKNATTKRKGRILINETYYDVYNVEYYADIYEDGKVIGNAIASQLDFDIPYISKFDTFKYYDGVWTGLTYEYVDMGTFIVFDEKDEDEFTKHITAFDKLINFNKLFEETGVYPKSLYDELTNICQQAEVQLENLSIPNGSFTVVSNQFTNGETLKTVLKELCAISGTYAIISNDKLRLQLRNTTSEEIDNTQHEPMIWKRRTYGINQVIIGDATIEGEYVIKQDDADIEQNGVHKLEILGNLFAPTQDARERLIDGLFNQVRGFGYIPYELKGEWLNYLEIGDTVSIDDVDTIILRILGKSPNALDSEMSAPAVIDSSIEYVDNTNTINNRMQRAERTVDKQNLIIEDIIETTDEQNTKISQITQTVNEINSKISDIADITVSAEDTDAQVELEDINESQPIQVKIHPIIQNISYDYPHNDYPQNDYPSIRILKFHNNDTNEDFYYELPEDLLYYDGENYDEFIMDYGDGDQTQECQVTKKCKWNADGSIGLLDTPEIHTYSYPSGEQAINLTDGDYTVSIVSYTYGYLFVRLMAKNIYTSQFYTKAETDSHINQKASEIELDVNQTLTNYSTTSEMNSAINLKATEITSTVSQTYSTKVETQNAKSEAISSSNSYADNVSSTAETNAKDYTNNQLQSYSTTTQMNSAIEQKANQITSSVSATYSTKTETNTAKNEAINSANASTDTKLTNYSTTNQMQTYVTQQISDSESSITSAVSTTYETKADATSKLNTSKTYADGVSSTAETNAKGYTDTQLGNYSTTTQMTNTITQAITNNNENYVDIEVAKKVNNSDYTKAQIVAKINDNTSSVQINADSISLAGKTIDMSAENIKIDSNCLSIDNSGKIELTDDGQLDANFIVTSNEGELYQRQTKVNSYGLWNYVGESGTNADNLMNISSMFGYPLMQFYDARDYTTYSSEMFARMLTLLKQTGGDQTITMITADGITTPTVTQTSKAELKKNFEKLENALDIIKNVDIYKYNLIGQNDTDKKHIGFVIGDDYKYSKEITSEDNGGADIYSFVSVCCKAIQEQQEQIEQLKQQIIKLKESEK